MVSLNEARRSHSSCILGSKIFVFGGRVGEGIFLDSIESLDLSYNQVWQLFRVQTFTPRCAAAVCAFSPTQIVIIGGEYFNGCYHSDVIVYNDKERSALQVAEAGFSFQCWSQTMTDGSGTVYSLVDPSQGNRCLIRYTASDN